MLKKIIVLITAFVCAQVFAEPMKMASKAELASAKKAAEGLLTSGVSADQVLQYAEEAKKSAEKYQLYCAAFKLYAKEEKAEEAAKVINTIQLEFIDAPDKDIVSMIEQHAKKLAKDNEELGAALSVSKMRASAASQLSKAKKELKKNPNSVEIKYQIAEAYAVLGDWKSALKQFKDAGGTVWQIASEELSGDVSAKIAAFWWDYKPRSKFNAEPAFKAHSAAIYEKLLKDGELSVLEKATAESRIEKAGHLGATKPKSELDKLKKICNTKGLVHCWRFNGDAKDCVGANKAKLIGNATQESKSVKLDGGRNRTAWIDLGNEVLDNLQELTLECWVEEHQISNWTRVFTIGIPGDDISISWTRGWDNWGCVYVRWSRDLSQFSNPMYSLYALNKEFHIALTISDEGANARIVAYIQDALTGATLDKQVVRRPNISVANLLKNKCLHLGHIELKGGDDAVGSYNEVRIWNRALSEEELTQNAIKFHKAGETMKK